MQSKEKSLSKKERWKKCVESDYDSIASSEKETFGEEDFNEE